MKVFLILVPLRIGNPSMTVPVAEKGIWNRTLYSKIERISISSRKLAFSLHAGLDGVSQK